MSFPTEVELGRSAMLYVNTHVNSSGAEADAAAAPTWRLYEEDDGTPIFTGSTAKLDDANTTGFYAHKFEIEAGSGFEHGKTYGLRVNGTVGGVTGSVVYPFNVYDFRRADLRAVNSLSAAADGLQSLSSIVPGGILSQVSSVSPPSSIWNFATRMVHEVQSLGDPALASVGSQVELGIAGAGLPASVWNHGTRILTANTNLLQPSSVWNFSPRVVHEVQSFGSPARASIGSEADLALVGVGLDHFIANAGSATDVATYSLYARLVSKEADPHLGSYDHTTDALEAIRDRGDAEWTGGGSGVSSATVTDIVSTQLSVLALHKLIVASVQAADVTTGAIVAAMVSKEADPHWGSFDNETDALEAIRDRGDANWSGTPEGLPSSIWNFATRVVHEVQSFGDPALASIGSQVQLGIEGSGLPGSVWNHGTRGLTEAVSLQADQSHVTVGVVNSLGTAALASVGSQVELGIAGADLPASVWNYVTRGLTEQVSLNADQSHVTIGVVNSFGTVALASVGSEAQAALAAAELPSSVWNFATRHVTSNANLNDPAVGSIMAAVLTTTMSEDYAANGSEASLAQAMYAVHQMLMQFSINSTTITVQKLDNGTTAFTVTANDDTNPTQAKRVT